MRSRLRRGLRELTVQYPPSARAMRTSLARKPKGVINGLAKSPAKTCGVRRLTHFAKRTMSAKELRSTTRRQCRTLGSGQHSKWEVHHSVQQSIVGELGERSRRLRTRRAGPIASGCADRREMALSGGLFVCGYLLGLPSTSAYEPLGSLGAVLVAGLGKLIDGR